MPDIVNDHGLLSTAISGLAGVIIYLIKQQNKERDDFLAAYKDNTEILRELSMTVAKALEKL